MSKKKAPEAAVPAQPEKDYEAENACDTLIRAEEIKKSPELLKRALKLHKKKSDAIRSLDDLHAAHQKVARENAGLPAKDEDDA